MNISPPSTTTVPYLPFPPQSSRRRGCSPRVSLLLAAATAVACPALSARAADEPSIEQLKQTMQELDQKIRVLERKLELEAEDKKAKPAPVLVAGEKGFGFESADGNFRLRLRGYLQTDARFFINDGDVPDNDTFLIRRARPIVEGTLFQNFDFRFMPDFAGSSTTIQDAYLNWRLRPEFQIQAGKFKAPVSLERLQSATALSFAERGFPAALLPNRDIGVMLHGSLFDARLDYAVGAFNGTTDSGSVIQDSDDSKDVNARLFAHPFRAKPDSILRGLGLGIAGTYGEHEGAPRLYPTPGQQTFFSYNAGVVNDGTVWRLSPQAYYYYGPFGLLAEYAVSSQEVSLGVNHATLHNSAWQVIATYVLTGEDASYRGVKPKHNINLDGSGWGAWEVAVRYGELDIDDDTFPVFGNPATRASKAKSVGVGLNWYLNPMVKFSTDYAYTDFSGGDTGPVSGQNEHVIFTRFQVSF